MKAIGIFRGFPGLGRVVSGVELIEHFKIHHNAEVKVFSYLQGETYIKQKGYETNFTVQNSDLSSLGIIPVSSYGEYIINQIIDFQPDFVLIDGEPLLTQLLKLYLPNLKVVVLLNPYDVENPYNQASSSLYFNELYSKADLAIVHGLWVVDKPSKYQNFSSLNTILRNEILTMPLIPTQNKISCILGGGTINTKSGFIENSVLIAKMCISVAKMYSDYEINIFCSSRNISDILNRETIPKNVKIYSTIEDCKKYYADSKLIISRAGRNTISEILYLGIPTILFPTGCGHRINEQKSNSNTVENLGNGLIKIIQDFDTNSFMNSVANLQTINRKRKMTWNSGNVEAVQLIISMLS